MPPLAVRAPKRRRRPLQRPPRPPRPKHPLRHLPRLKPLLPSTRRHQPLLSLRHPALRRSATTDGGTNSTYPPPTRVTRIRIRRHSISASHAASPRVAHRGTADTAGNTGGMTLVRTNISDESRENAGVGGYVQPGAPSARSATPPRGPGQLERAARARWACGVARAASGPSWRCLGQRAVSSDTGPGNRETRRRFVQPVGWTEPSVSARTRR